uniref:1-phosphatidylinositol 4-kinase n=1 Tax=Strongyloides papillosus TaxID=174720 RepID=A0A0N5B712_STREA
MTISEEINNKNIYEGEFSFNNLHCMALCCAKIDTLSLEDIHKKLLGKVCTGIENVGLNDNTRNSLIATAIFVVNSDGKLSEPLTMFLLECLQKIWEVEWNEEEKSGGGLLEKMTIYERFTFTFNTALSDIAVKFPLLKEIIINNQIKLMNDLINIITNTCDETKVYDELGKANLMKLLCILLGIVRSCGRFCNRNSPSLISILYPTLFKTNIDRKEIEKIKLSTDSSNWFGTNISDKNIDMPVDKKIFLRPGSSFIMVDEACKNLETNLTLQNMETIMEGLEKLLKENILERLDIIAAEVYKSPEFKRFHYKSISEILTLACITIVQEFLKRHANDTTEQPLIPIHFVKYLNTYALNMFERGEKILKKLKEEENDGVQWSNKIKQTIITNSICLDIIAESAIDESDGDTVIETISEHMFNPHRNVTAYTPIVVAALRGLGVLAEKFPTISNISIVPLLQKFLLEPCLLLKQIIVDIYGLGKSVDSRDFDDYSHHKYQGLVCLRNSAIDALCCAVKSAKKVEENSEKSCMASLSVKLYLSANITKNTVNYFVAETAILILGKLGIVFKDVPNVPESVLQIFLQRFANPKGKLDIVIVNCLADMWLNGATSIFEQIMKLFTQVIVESSNHVYSSDGNEKSENKYSHVSLEVDKILSKIADSVSADDSMKEILLTRYLELFVQLAIESRKSGEKVSKGTMKITTSAGNLGVLIPKIASILRRFPKYIQTPNQKLINMFREFWSYCTVLGFDVSAANLWPEDWHEAVCEISTKSPIFIANENLKTELIDNVGISTVMISATELQELRLTLCNELRQNPDCVSIINRLDFTYCIYLLSVIRMEKMRVVYSNDVETVHVFLKYVENPAIKKDKNGMWTCIMAASHIIFEEYINTAKMKQDSNSNSLELKKQLVHHARFFLVQFNHHMKEVRRIADACLSKLVDAFPYLLWNGEILFTGLQLLQSLSTNLENDTECKQIFLPVDDLPWKIQLQSTLEERKEIAKDFTGRCEQILSEAMRWAPGSTHSYILDYICKTNSTNDNSLRLTIEAVLKNCKNQSSDIYHNTYPYSPDISEFFLSLNMRSLYLGQVNGMLEMLKLSSGDINEEFLSKTLVSKLEKDFEKACLTENKEGIKTSIMLMTALFISLDETNISLLQTLVRAPIKSFTESTMKICIHSWNWILVAKKGIEIKFLQEMSSCWQIIIHKKIGLFQREDFFKDPLTVQYAKKRQSPDVLPHAIWISFITERVSLAKYSNQAEMDLFEMMFMQSFSLAIGDKITKNSTNYDGSNGCDSGSYLTNHIPLMTRNIETIGVRFNILNAVLSMIQGDTSPNRISKNVLRQRIYAAAFDYFSIAPQVPTQSIGQLRNDLKQIIGFWQTIYSDLKYIKKEATLNHLDSVSEFGGSLKGGNALNPSTLNMTNSAISQNFTWHSLTNNNSSWANTITIVAAHNKTIARGSVLTDNQSQHTQQQRRDRTVNKINEYDKAIKESSRRRHLLLLLLCNEIERLSVWVQASQASIDPIPTEQSEQSIDIWYKTTFPDARTEQKTMRDVTKNAWEVSPQMAVFLPSRFRKIQCIRSTLEELTKENPSYVSHLPEALPLLLGDGSVFENGGNENILSHVLTWAKCSPVMALSLLNPRLFPTHSITVQYAIRVLKGYPPNVLLLYIPQIVQAIRHDTMGYVHDFLIWLAGHSQLLAHQLLWNMQANIYLDEEGELKDPVLYEPLTEITNKILSNLEGAARSFYTAEFNLFNKITRISGAIKSFPKGIERKKACLAELAKVKLDTISYLPSNPESFLLEIDYNSGTPMQSAAKAPFLAKFSVCQCGVDKLEAICLERNRLNPYEDNCDFEEEERRIRMFNTFKESTMKEFSHSIQWKCAIFKVGDDVRQDMLALQLMQLMKNIFDMNNINVCLFPYRVVATAPGCGVIECVPNSKSRDQLGRQTDYGLYDYFRQLYGEETCEAFQKARRNFIRSMAAYSVFSFLLQIKDRHNGNIMIDDSGNIIHIDFGFMFESSPGGNLGFEPDFKLSQEMVAIMGGKMEAAPFKQFVQYCIQSYLAIRPYYESFIALVSLMLDTGLPCFRGKTIQQFRARFSPDTNEREAARYMMTVINNCYMNVRSKMYDQLQYLQNDIPY